MTGYAKDALVTTQWVHDHVDADGLRIVEVDERPALDAEGHGARRDRARLARRPQ